MLLTLIKKEIVGHLLSLRFIITFLLTIILVFVGFTLSSGQYERSREEYGSRQRDYRQRLDRIARVEDDWNRFDQAFSTEGIFEAVPLSPMSSVVLGLAPTTPAAINLTTNGWINEDRSAAANPLAGLFNVPDLGFLVGVVMSLLAILFVFDCVSGEKEAGTLRLMLSNAVPRHTVLLSKWIGGFLVLMAPFVVVFAGGVGYVWARGTLDMTGEHLARLGMLLVVALIYISAFFNLGMFISCCTHRSTTSLFLGLLIWVGTVLAVPNLAPVLAKIAAPTPRVGQIEAEKEAIDKEIDLKKRRLSATVGGLSYGKDRMREEEKLEAEKIQRQRRWDRFLEESTRRQTRLAGILGRFSPTASWLYAATELGNTGMTTQDQFDQSRRRMHEQFEEKQRDILKAWGQNNWSTAPDMHLDDMPALRLSFATLEHSMSNILEDALLLAIVNVVFFMLAFMFFLRYDVR